MKISFLIMILGAIILVCLITPVQTSREGLASKEPGGYPTLSLGEQTSSVGEEKAPDENSKSGTNMNDYILKSQIVPPVCPACPPPCDRTEGCPPCPPCARCPAMPFRCERVPVYSEMNPGSLPQPLVNRIL